MIDQLTYDELTYIVSKLDSNDHFAFALTCREARNAISHKIKTSIKSAIESYTRIKWLNSCGLPLSKQLFSSAIKKGDIDLITFLHENECDKNKDNMDILLAVYTKQIDVIKWLIDNDGAYFCVNCSIIAADSYDLEMLEWLKEQNCPLHTYAYENAAKIGRFDILKWLFNNGCRFNERTCAHAAESGNLEIVTWLISVGCVWCIDETCTYAVKGDNIKILEMAFENGCIIDNETFSTAS